MCTYLTEKIAISGSAKGAAGATGWFRVTDGSVYQGPSARVAVELSAESARALMKAIEAVLESAPPGLE